ncbi:hypothetical protein [Shewanella sp. GD04112]|uniref:hypothetical protein n=1 Tax=Shewanella sp. GD04112 TaxID=2975434 RepID=UPI0024471E39|nr:hypothetical protein [Shewanella sp. GD04112]MDH0450894.1 hypothetical protein [Shewanella sp. GD04112]
MKTLFLAHDKNETSVLGWSFESEEDAYDCAESNGYTANSISEIECVDSLTESDFDSCAYLSEYECVAENALEESED